MSLWTAVAGRARQCTCVGCILQLGICAFEVEEICKLHEVSVLTMSDVPVIALCVVHMQNAADVAAWLQSLLDWSTMLKSTDCACTSKRHIARCSLCTTDPATRSDIAICILAFEHVY